MWWCTAIILALRWLKLEDREVRTSPGNLVRPSQRKISKRAGDVAGGALAQVHGFHPSTALKKETRGRNKMKY
jgi:hypothetical protein